MTGYQALANGIIEQAVKDYRAALKTLRRHPDSKAAMATAMEVERFFHSSWFAVLTDIDPDYLIERLRKAISTSNSSSSVACSTGAGFSSRIASCICSTSLSEGLCVPPSPYGQSGMWFSGFPETFFEAASCRPQSLSDSGQSVFPVPLQISPGAHTHIKGSDFFPPQNRKKRPPTVRKEAEDAWALLTLQERSESNGASDDSGTRE